MIGDLSIGPAREPARASVQGAGARSPGPAPAPAEPAETARVDPANAEVGRLKALLTDPGVRVSMHRDDPSGRVVLTVQDQATGRVVEQFPSEKMLRLYATLLESLIDQQI
jgi:uncharacterized FlaG/YvyC family protein